MSLRRPVCRINGVPAMEAEILAHRHQSASAFSATLSMTMIEQSGGSVSDWIDKRPEVTISGAKNGGQGRPLIKGKVDSAEANFEARTIRIEGRDATAALLDTLVDPTQDQFKNKSPEDVIKEIAGRRGLSVETDGGGGSGGGSGSQKAGRTHVNDEYDLLTAHESEWNVIVTLAERMGKVAWVEDKTLHVKSAQAQSESSGGGLVINYKPPKPGAAEGNFVGLRCTVNFVVSEGVSTTVDTHHLRDKKEYSGQGGSGGGESAQYKGELPGMKQEQVQTVAKAKAVEISRHARRVVYDGPGDENLTVNGSLTLKGTRTQFDDTYPIMSIRWFYDGSGSKFDMTVDAQSKGEGGE